MDLVQYITKVILFNALAIILFFKVNHIAFTRKTVLIALSLRLVVACTTATLNALFSSSFFSYITEPLYGLLFSWVFLRPTSKTLLIFYGFLTATLWNIFYRMVLYFIIPFFGQPKVLLENVLLYFVYDSISVLSVLLFLKWLGYDFVKYNHELADLQEKKVLFTANWVMALYFFVMEVLTYFEYEHEVVSRDIRQFILVIYLVLFMGMMKQLDSHLRVKLQEKLAFQQSLQIRGLENYSKQVEELYREVRGFRHDYTNLLTTLRLGIESDDMVQIKEVYDTVLKDSNKQFRHRKYNIARVINIDNSALKSLLAAKFIEANEQQIEVTLEVPEKIELQGMKLVDFITIVAILIDNALEAALEASNPKVNIAFLKFSDKQLFVIENTIKEQAIDISDMCSFGTSSKGEGRGVGLYNVMKILESYPAVSLNSRSQDHTFCQILEIGL